MSNENQVYLLFYSDLINKTEVVLSNGYTPSIVDLLMDKEFPFLSRCSYYFSPPFSCVKIAFKNSLSNIFETYGFNFDNNFNQVNGDFLHRSGWSVLRLQISPIQYNLLRELINVFCQNVQYYRQSFTKTTLLGGKLRYYLNLSPLPYPLIKQKYWMCSEFVCFLLQQSGIIKSNSIHPSYCSPTHVFFEAILSSFCKIETSFNPFWQHELNNVITSHTNTNAYTVFCKVLNLSDDDVPHYIQKNLSKSLCKKFVCQNQPLTQYDIFQSLQYNKISIKEDDFEYDDEKQTNKIKDLLSSKKLPSRKKKSDVTQVKILPEVKPTYKMKTSKLSLLV